MDQEVNYVWPFDLESYEMTKDVKEDFLARVRIKQSLTTEDIARMVSAERTEYRVDTLVNTTRLMDEKTRQLIAQGYNVVTGTAQFSPSITGTFIGKTGAVDPERNKCVVNINPSASLRRELENVTPQFSGNVKNLGGARIALVKDVATGNTDGTVTPGNILDVTGTKIRCVGEDGISLGSLTLVNIADQSVAATITSFGHNDPSRLMFTLPANVPAGSYRLTLTTWFSTNKTQLKEPRTLTYDIPLRVGAASGGDEGGEDIL